MDGAEAPHLMEVVRRVKTPEDAEVAMEVARQYALQRAHRQQHDGLSPNMSYLILKVHCLLRLCSESLLHSHHCLSSALQQAISIRHQRFARHLVQPGYPRCILLMRSSPLMAMCECFTVFCHSRPHMEGRAAHNVCNAPCRSEKEGVLQSITKVSVDKALDVIKSSRELALTFERRGFRDIIVRASKAGDLPAIRR